MIIKNDSKYFLDSGLMVEEGMFKNQIKLSFSIASAAPNENYMISVMPNKHNMFPLFSTSPKKAEKSEDTIYFTETLEMDYHFEMEQGILVKVKKEDKIIGEIPTSLGNIIGEEISEDLVNEIFSKFCMGK